MGTLVTLATLPYRDVAGGVTRAAITGDEMKAMSADVTRLAPGAMLTESVPAGSDRYLFTLAGAVTLHGRGRSHAMPEESFAAIQEGTEFTLANGSRGEATLIGVLAPPPGRSAARAGFSEGLTVAARSTTPAHEVPEEKKRRVYFVGEEAAPSERAHAMIVEYVRDTVTSLHMHPDADSMFVFLSGTTRFTINGRDEVIRRGQATCVPMGNRHGLAVAEGEGVSFLEFHIPATYATVKG
jgi:mannose-6-phosphate isomerase-like protein (cupin superfamily)